MQLNGAGVPTFTAGSFASGPTPTPNPFMFSFQAVGPFRKDKLIIDVSCSSSSTTTTTTHSSCMPGGKTSSSSSKTAKGTTVSSSSNGTSWGGGAGKKGGIGTCSSSSSASSSSHHGGFTSCKKGPGPLIGTCGVGSFVTPVSVATAVPADNDEVYSSDFEPDEQGPPAPPLRPSPPPPPPPPIIMPSTADWREKILQQQRCRLKRESERLLLKEQEERELLKDVEVVAPERDEEGGWLVIGNIESTDKES